VIRHDYPGIEFINAPNLFAIEKATAPAIQPLVLLTKRETACVFSRQKLRLDWRSGSSPRQVTKTGVPREPVG
jgi:hypothetical protein